MCNMLVYLFWIIVEDEYYQANPLAANCSKSRLTRQMRTGKLRLLNAKISTGTLRGGHQTA